MGKGRRRRHKSQKMRQQVLGDQGQKCDPGLLGSPGAPSSNGEIPVSMETDSHTAQDESIAVSGTTPPSLKRTISEADLHDNNIDDDNGWLTIQNGRPTKKKTPGPVSRRYPAVTFSPSCRLNSKIGITDLRDLVLYIFADGPAPQWVSVSNRPEFRKIVAIQVPGLEEAMFKHGADMSNFTANAAGLRENSANKARLAADDPGPIGTSPDEYYPRELDKAALSPSVQGFADMFKHLWPVKAPGNDRDRKMYSPIQTFLTAPVPKNKYSAPPAGLSLPDVRTRITEYLSPPEELIEAGFPPHPAFLRDEDQRQRFLDPEGWMHTNVETMDDGKVPEQDIEQGSVTAGRKVLAIDCEMCLIGPIESALTRISLVDWDGNVVMDELVKPSLPITDYLTQFSGITKEKLEGVMTTLQDVQKRLLGIVDKHTILVGHSVDADLKAIQVSHPFIVDTSIVFPHPRGLPLRSSLKFLTQKFLNQQIQAGGQGHSSIEDATACLRLVQKKCEKGKHWGATEMQGENLFRRLARAGTSYRSTVGPAATGGAVTGKVSAAVDWHYPGKRSDFISYPCNMAAHAMICASDCDIEAKVMRAVNGDADGFEIPGGGVDFVWARLRDIESLRGWTEFLQPDAKDGGSAPTTDAAAKGTCEPGATAPKAPETDTGSPQRTHHHIPLRDSSPSANAGAVLEACLASLTARLQRIHDVLPPCTLFIVFSGLGDPREMRRLQDMYLTYRREYAQLPWDKLSVQWTDTEDQALRLALRVARSSIGFIGVK